MSRTASVKVLAAASFITLLAISYPALADEIDEAKATCQQRVAEEQNVAEVKVEFAKKIETAIEVRGQVTQKSGTTTEFFCEVGTIGDMQGKIVNVGYR